MERRALLAAQLVVGDSGVSPGDPQEFTRFNDALYFVASDPAHGKELWRTDGTRAGTKLVADVLPGTESSSPGKLTVAGSTSYFSAVATSGAQPILFKSDGVNVTAVQGASPGQTLPAPDDLTASGNRLWFHSGSALWHTDGVTTTKLSLNLPDVTDIVAMPSGVAFSIPNQLWSSGGTDSTTFQIYKFKAEEQPVSLYDLVAVGGRVYFVRTGGIGSEALWRTDGTRAGTIQIVGFNTAIDNLTRIGTGSAFIYSSDRSLWFTSGEPGDPQRVHSFASSGRGLIFSGDSLTMSSFVPFGKSIAFSVTNPTYGGMWITDGTARGTYQVARSQWELKLTSMGERLFGIAPQGETWRSDGRAKNTRLLDVMSGGTSATPSLGVINNGLLLPGIDAARGTGLFRIDLTTSTIAGSVFIDLNGDGIKSPGEFGLSGYQVFLDRNNNTVRNRGESIVTSDGGGRYSFEGLAPGTHRVRLVPRGGTIGPEVHVVTLDTADRVVKHFANANDTINNPPVLTMGGTVFQDTDADQRQDVGDAGLAGFRVYLDLDGDKRRDVGEPTTRTDGAGRYSFGGLRAGTYKVGLTPVGGYLSTSKILQSFTIAPGGTSSKNFGNQQLARVNGVAFQDYDQDGFRDAGEPGLAGIPVVVKSNTYGVEYSASTDAQGQYSIEVRPGEAIVDSGPLGRWRRTSSGSTMTVTGGQTPTFDIGLTRTVLMSGTVYGGHSDPAAGEGLAGARVFLDTNFNDVFNEGETSVFTDGQGRYVLPPQVAGSYRVGIAPPDFSWQDPGPARDVTLASGRVATVDFFILQNGQVGGTVVQNLDNDWSTNLPSELVAGAVVYVDANQNGQLDPGERASAPSASNGRYLINNVGDGSYELRVAPPPGFRSWPQEVFVEPGSRSERDMGVSSLAYVHVNYFEKTAAGTQQVDGVWLVYADVNLNGQLDQGDVEMTYDPYTRQPNGWMLELPAGTYTFRIYDSFGAPMPSPVTLTLKSGDIREHDLKFVFDLT